MNDLSLDNGLVKYTFFADDTTLALGHGEMTSLERMMLVARLNDEC